MANISKIKKDYDRSKLIIIGSSINGHKTKGSQHSADQGAEYLISNLQNKKVES